MVLPFRLAASWPLLRWPWLSLTTRLTTARSPLRGIPVRAARWLYPQRHHWPASGGIGDYAFFNNTSLTSVTMPGSVTSIQGYAFAGCSALTNVTIPSSVTYVGYEVFSDCSSLTAITVDPNNPSYSGSAGVLFDKSQSALIAFTGWAAPAVTRSLAVSPASHPMLSMAAPASSASRFPAVTLA